MLALFAACCGVVVKDGKPYVDQWPASVAKTMAVDGLAQVTDAKRSTRAKNILRKLSTWHDEGSFTAIYTDSTDRRRLATVAGITRFISSPGGTIDTAFTTIGPDLGMTTSHRIPIGAAQAVGRCGTGRVDGQRVVVCGWADHGSLAVAMYTNRSETEGAAMIRTLRQTLIVRRSN